MTRVVADTKIYISALMFGGLLGTFLDFALTYQRGMTVKLVMRRRRGELLREDMSDDSRRLELWRQAQEALRAADREAELLGPDPELLSKYAGHWVIIQGGHIVASAPSGLELAGIADIRNYPNAAVLFVPPADEQAGVHILHDSLSP